MRSYRFTLPRADAELRTSCTVARLGMRQRIDQAVAGRVRPRLMNAPLPFALRDLSTHFQFGENWRSFATAISRNAVDEAKEGLLRLLPAERWRGASVIDIGCGSGIHALSAVELGADVLAIDIDPVSVATTAAVTAGRAEARTLSVFEATGSFDIVYSWGVLHHTGDMWKAVERAAALVAPGGSLVLALYQKTTLCRGWKLEKRLYTAAPALVRSIARSLYAAVFFAGLLATARRPFIYVRNYKSKRGMDFWHDIHDWLGGFPYESASQSEVRANMDEHGFVLERLIAARPKVGLLGAGCAQYVFRRR